MSGIFDKLAASLEFPFVRYALIVGTLIALCSSLFGVTLVLKRFSFIGDGLSHVAFGAMAIAMVLRLTNEMPLVLVLTIISAVLLLRTGQNTKIRGDAAVAMVRGCVLHPFWCFLHFDPVPDGGMAQRGPVFIGSGAFCIFLQQDFCRDLR